MKLRSLRIGTRLGWGFGVVGALIIVMMAIGLWGMSSIHAGADSQFADGGIALAVGDIEHHGAELVALQGIYAMEASRGTPGATDESNPERKLYLAEVKEMDRVLDALAAQGLTPAQAQQLAAFRQTYEAFKANGERMVALYRQATPTAIRSADDLAHDAAVTDMITATGPLEALSADAVKGRDQAHADVVGTDERTSLVTAVVGVIAVLLAVAMAVMITRSVTRPLTTTVTLLRTVATGDLRGRLDSDSPDEIGQMGAAMNEALDRMGETISSIERTATTLLAASEELSAVSRQMSAASEETAAQAASVSAAAEQVSHNVQAAAAATTELAASEDEIARSTASAAHVASDAVESAGQATHTVASLGSGSAEIGEVVRVITSIAEQINLLALNATIEAARAGEVGKSFAVVANEVKDLARKTAQSSDEIGRKIDGMQTSAAEAGAAITGITDVIGRINDVQAAVASSVEEQTAATNEIGRSMGEAAIGSSEIARSITDVSQAARDTTQGAAQTHQSAEELARLAADLAQLVNRFKVDAQA